MINIVNIIDTKKCFEEIRKIRWKDGVVCPECGKCEIKKNGFNYQNIHKQHYKCKNCKKRFDDLTGTPFAKSKQSISVLMIFLYFMGLNLSNNQIAKELQFNNF